MHVACVLNTNLLAAGAGHRLLRFLNGNILYFLGKVYYENIFNDLSKLVKCARALQWEKSKNNRSCDMTTFYPYKILNLIYFMIIMTSII